MTRYIVLLTLVLAQTTPTRASGTQLVAKNTEEL